MEQIIEKQPRLSEQNAINKQLLQNHEFKEEQKKDPQVPQEIGLQNNKTRKFHISFFVRQIQNRTGIPTISQPHRQHQDVHCEINEENNLLGQLDRIGMHQKYLNEKEDFILKFNKDPFKTVKNMNNLTIAMRLIETDGLNKEMIGIYFGDPNTQSIFKQFCSLIDFSNIEVDQALRLLFRKFKLPGETEQIERIIESFSEAWYKDNKSNFQIDPQQLYVLCFSMIMLNTDAHSNLNVKKMTLQEFIRNTSPVVPKMSRQYLQKIYTRIVQEKFQTKIDHIQKIYNRLNLITLDRGIKNFIEDINELNHGNNFVKYCRNKSTVQRLLYVDKQNICWRDPANPQQTPRFIKLDDITDLTLGCSTQTMKLNDIPPQYDHLCFSIITTKRSLDLRAFEKKIRVKWITFIASILIEKRNKMRKKRQEIYYSNENKQKILQIWYEDIFPNWEKHWDYSQDKCYNQPRVNIANKFCNLFLSCFENTEKKNQATIIQEQSFNNLPHIKSPLLSSIWKLGIPKNCRKSLWSLSIGNNLAINEQLYKILLLNFKLKTQPFLKKKRQKIFKTLDQLNFEKSKQIKNVISGFNMMRPDVTIFKAMFNLVNNLLDYMSEFQAFRSFSNLLHKYYFLSFFRSDMKQVQIRILFFDQLFQTKMPILFQHFKALDLSSEMFLISWFITLFSDLIQNKSILNRLMDVFFIEGQIYCYKVSFAVLKYYELQLKMAVFQEASKLLKRLPDDLSEPMLFELIEQETILKKEFQNFVLKKQHGQQNIKLKQSLLH